MFRRRPSRSTTLFALAALACAVGAASIVSSYAAHLEALLPATGAPVPIVVATRAIERGATVAADDLQVVELPEAFVPAGALRQPTSAIGERALTAFAPGEVVTPGRIAGGVMGPLAALVPPGLRAVPIVVSAVPTGLVRGDLIDVVSTYGEGRMYAETVGRELELLAAPGGGDASSTGVGGGGTQLVVLADPATATRLARASAASVLSIAVVGSDGG